jgi:hypothetical protein
VVKIITAALVISAGWYLFFYVPKRLKPGKGPRIRYAIFSVFAVVFLIVLVKRFL